MTKTPEWIAVDWGTSNLRAWVMDERDQVIAALQSDQGMGQLAPDAFEEALLDVVGSYLGQDGLPVVACGMVGAKQGWCEAPYAKTPCAPPGRSRAIRPLVRDARLDVAILPGISQLDPAPDVMRGEETQIAGFLRTHPKFDGVLCMPGTHTKWVHISAGEIVSFRTCMTGELFALLSDQSVLRHSVSGPDWDADAFATAVSDGLSQPQALTARLFGLRAGGLLQGMSNATARATLSGLLLGVELGGTRPYWLGQEIAIIGAPRLSELYHTALATAGAPATCHDGADIVLSGLIAAYRETDT